MLTSITVAATAGSMKKYTWQNVFTGWFKVNTLYCVSHECRMHQILECHMFVFILTAMNIGRGWQSQFFCSRPRVGVTGENLRPPTTVPQRSVMVMCFRRKILFYTAGSGYPKAPLQKVSPKYLMIWLHTADIKSYLTAKIDPILKLSHLCDFHMFSAHKPKRYAVYGREILNFCRHVR